jgi:hypothetical protein
MKPELTSEEKKEKKKEKKGNESTSDSSQVLPTTVIMKAGNWVLSATRWSKFNPKQRSLTTFS